MRLALAIALLLVGAAPDDFKEAAAKLAQAMAQRDHDKIAAAIKDLPESDDRTAKLLIETLKTGDWWTKGKIVVALGRPPALKAILQELETGKRKDVREACALALSSHDGDGVVAALAKSLAEPDWRVRRAASQALASKVSRGRVDALVARLAEEKDASILLYIVARLSTWTRQSFGPKADAWSEWWKAHRDDELDEQAAREGHVEFKDFKLKHETVAGPNTKLGIVVMPDFPARPGYFRPHLDFLSAHGTLHYVRLPDPRDLATERAPNGNPIYPVESMVGALEKLRDEFKEEKLVLVAHGLTVWLAMAYARNYPESIAGLVFFGAYVDDDSFSAAAGRARSEAAQKRDTFLEEIASFRLGKRVPWKTGHYVATFTEFAADPQELALARVYNAYFEDYLGVITVPDIRATFLQPIPTPALFLYGRHDAFSGLPEYRRATKYLSAAQAVAFDASGALPFLSESDKFAKTMVEFMGRIQKKR